MSALDLDSTARGMAVPADHWDLSLPGGRHLLLGNRPRVMGILNVTPDSFSDGGLFIDPERAIAHGLELLQHGADLIDIGAESTRPGGGVYGQGAAEVSAEEECARLLPVLRGMRQATAAPLSVDTRKAAVARAALDAGADLVNDVSSLGDPEMAGVVAAAGCPLVLMHSRGELRTMQNAIQFDDVVLEVRNELRGAMLRAERGGIGPAQIVLDPGIGFGKTASQNLLLIRRLDALAELGRPLLLGASRKSFIGHLTGAPPSRRGAGSLAAVAWALLHGVAIVRAHDVVETVQFLKVFEAVRAAQGAGA
jgi:dihydropteroate synthase